MPNQQEPIVSDGTTALQQRLQDVTVPVFRAPMYDDWFGTSDLHDRIVALEEEVAELRSKVEFNERVRKLESIGFVFPSVRK